MPQCLEVSLLQIRQEKGIGKEVAVVSIGSRCSIAAWAIQLGRSYSRSEGMERGPERKGTVYQNG